MKRSDYDLYSHLLTTTYRQLSNHEVTFTVSTTSTATLLLLLLLSLDEPVAIASFTHIPRPLRSVLVRRVDSHTVSLPVNVSATTIQTVVPLTP